MNKRLMVFFHFTAAAEPLGNYEGFDAIRTKSSSVMREDNFLLSLNEVGVVFRDP